MILYEAVEKTLMDHLGLRYLHAHQIATRAEQAAVRAAGISWDAYDRFMRMYVKSIGDKRLGKVPRDLDLKPYRDERDNEVLRRIAAALDKGPMRMGFRAYRVRDLADGQRRKTAPLKHLPTLSLEASGHQSGRGGPARPRRYLRCRIWRRYTNSSRPNGAP